jgi:excisionase family DNA binding protein
MSVASPSTNSASPPLLVKSRAAATTLSVSERTLWALTAPRGPIPAIRVGRSVRYSLADLRAWIDAQRGTRS